MNFTGKKKQSRPTINKFKSIFENGMKIFAVMEGSFYFSIFYVMILGVTILQWTVFYGSNSTEKEKWNLDIIL